MKSDKSERSLTTPEEMAELASLYDTYGNLLKDGQRDIFEAYVLDNLSLSEIAEEQKMTRQGVYDTINRTRKKLREYDEKLGLMERSKGMESIIDSIAKVLALSGGDMLSAESRKEISKSIDDLKELI
jgi:predicted DNA-binding protein YlxM (UPF0122 family)